MTAAGRRRPRWPNQRRNPGRISSSATSRTSQRRSGSANPCRAAGLRPALRLDRHDRPAEPLRPGLGRPRQPHRLRRLRALPDPGGRRKTMSPSRCRGAGSTAWASMATGTPATTCTSGAGSQRAVTRRLAPGDHWLVIEVARAGPRRRLPGRARFGHTRRGLARLAPAAIDAETPFVTLALASAARPPTGYAAPVPRHPG